jgi:hypothetical protein
VLGVPSGTYRVAVCAFEVIGARSDVQITFEIAAGPQRGARFAYITRAALERAHAGEPYPAFARFVAAATGIECGDSAQQTVDEDVLVGRRLEIVVRTGPSGFPNVVRFAPAAAAPRRACCGVSPRHVDVLAHSTPYDADQLPDIVESVSRGRTRALARLSVRERETLISRMSGAA